jgi:HlyD family secretion protein
MFSGICCESVVRMRRAHLYYLMLAVLGAAALTVVMAQLWRKTPPTVDLAAVTRGPINREVLTNGVLEPKLAVDTGSQVSGTIQSLRADFNARVRAGQVLAQIDPAPYDTRLAEARAEKIQAEAEAERRRSELDDLQTKSARAVELAAGGLITQAELDAAQFAVRQASAALKAAVAASRVATASVNEAQVNRERTTIRSPIDGLVVSRNVEIGQTIAASFSSPVLFRIADLRQMQLLADVGEAEAGEVRRGVPVTFEIESIGPRQFDGVISDVRLAPVVEQGSTGTSGTTTPSQPVAAPATGGTTTAATGATGGATRSTASSASTSNASTGSSRSSPSSTTTTASTATAPTAPVGTVTSYTAVIDVDNSDGLIVPGSTAVVTLPTAQRADVVRVPNAALSFRPTPDALKASGQENLKLPTEDRTAGTTEGQGIVFKYDAGKFVPIPVETGASDERWTEVTSGEIQPGDQLVTQFSIPRR